MKRTVRNPKAADELRPEYDFNYGEAQPNRFPSRMRGSVVAVILDPDVAAVFDSSESVNRILRSVISALPKTRRRKTTERPRRKAG
jgi:hypothetical protein